MISLSCSGEHLKNLRHLASKLLAFTVRDLFPTAQLVGGDLIDIGFFYDFIFEQPLYDQALTLIEIRMKTLLKGEITMRMLDMMRENAHAFFMHHKQPLLAERSLSEEHNIISLIQLNDFYDLCPALSDVTITDIKAIKVLGVTQAKRFFPQQENGMPVTRITGTAFTDPSMLKKFLKAWNQFKRRDHRLLGPELDLFSFEEEAGNLDCFWHPKGEILRQLLLQIWKQECYQQHAQFITTPLLVKESFVKQQHLLPSLSLEEETYVLSRSRLSHDIQLFKRCSSIETKLPFRFAECAREYQYVEDFRSWGLLRSYSSFVDRLTIFCTEDQVINELISSLQFIEQIVRIFGFEGHWYLVSSGKKGSKQGWENQVISWLMQAVQNCQMTYKSEVQGSFYSRRGPSLERRLVDCLGREWKGPSIEMISSHPNGLSISRQKDEGGKKIPVILMRSLFGSLDRFIALLIERFEGVFPLWLAPEQIRVLVIGSQNEAYAEAIYKSCQQQGIRTQLDIRQEKLAERIHTAEKQKIPYLIIVGDKEKSKKLVTIRAFQQKGVSNTLSLESFFEKFHQECYFPGQGEVGQNINK